MIFSESNCVYNCKAIKEQVLPGLSSKKIALWDGNSMMITRVFGDFHVGFPSSSGNEMQRLHAVGVQ